MAAVTMRQLLESGVHFGHQTRRWNPKMKRYIFGERSGTYIIDLQQTIVLLERARSFVKAIAERDGIVLFVGTKKQCKDSIIASATSANMPYVANRWLGGLLTNWGTVNKRVERLHELRRQSREDQLKLLPTRERLKAIAELEKLETNLGGVAEMERLPDAVVVVDLNNEAIAVKECNRLKIPIIGLVDTNCDPDEATYIIPGNDDAIRSCDLVLGALAEGAREGRGMVQAAADDADAPVTDAPAADAPVENAPVDPVAEAAPDAAATVAQESAPEATVSTEATGDADQTTG